MITIRTARQSAFRISRHSSIIGGIESVNFPHAESSSAPSRRLYASTATATVVEQSEPQSNQSSSSGSVNRPDGTENGKPKGKERRSFKPNSRAKKQAIANARRLNEAFQSEKAAASARTSSISSQPSDASSTYNEPSSSIESGSSTSDRSFWSDMLTTPSSTLPVNTNTNTTSSSPTLEDLLSKKPERDPPDPWHPIYPELYKKLINNIDSAFVKQQLKSFSTQLGIYHNAKASKTGLIKKILKYWNWSEPRSKPVERPPEPHIYDLPSPELFLFLRDSELIQSMTKGYDRLELSVLPLHQAPSTTSTPPTVGDRNRMVLVAVGKVGPIANLTQIIQDRRKTIRTIEVPSEELNGLKAPAGLLQTVSNATGSYVEPISDDKYRITAMSIEDAQNAKRVLGMAALRTNVLPSNRSLGALLPTPRHFQTQPLRLSLYPFTPSLTESLPWSISSLIDQKTLFRLKKVTKWNSKPAIREIDQKNEKIDIAPFMEISPKPSSVQSKDHIDDSEIKEKKPLTEEEKEIQNQFQHLLLNLSFRKGKKKFKFIFGNLLFPITPKEGNKLGTFDNPLPGQWPIETVKNWLSPPPSTPYQPSPSPEFLAKISSRKPVFTPTLTPSMIQFPLTNGKSSEIRRIRYRSTSNSPAKGESRFVQFTSTKSESSNNWQDHLGAMLDKLEKQIELEEKDLITPAIKEENVERQDITNEENHISESPSVGPTPDEGVKAGSDNAQTTQKEISHNEPPKSFEAVIGVIKEVDLFIPDRPNDVRIESTSTVTLPTEKTPESILLLFEAEQGTSVSPISPPTKLIVKDEEYQLEFDERIEIVEESQSVDVLGNSYFITKRCIRVVQEEGLGGLGKPLVYSELECGANSYGTLPPEFYRELAFITRDIGPDAGALRRNNTSILSALSYGSGTGSGSE